MSTAVVDYVLHNSTSWFDTGLRGVGVTSTEKVGHMWAVVGSIITQMAGSGGKSVHGLFSVGQFPRHPEKNLVASITRDAGSTA